MREVLVDPASISTALVVFPFHTPLREHAAAYLAAKYSHELAAARHLLLAEGESALEGEGEADEERNQAGYYAAWLSTFKGRKHRHGKAKSGRVSRVLLTVWTAVLFLPEDAQAIVIEDTLMGLTILVSLAQDLIHEIESHTKVSLLIAAGIVALLALSFCLRSRKNRWLVNLDRPESAPRDLRGSVLIALGFGTMTKTASQPVVEDKAPEAVAPPFVSEVEFEERVRNAVRAGNGAIFEEGCVVKFVSASLTPSPSVALEKVGFFNQTINQRFVEEFAKHIGHDSEEGAALVANLLGDDGGFQQPRDQRGFSLF